jgi:hypothetical protein
MQKDNLNILFSEYRQCIRQQILADLDKDAEINYYKKCFPQIEEIVKAQAANVKNAFRTDHELDHNVDAMVDQNIYKLKTHEWSEKRIKNM